MASLVVRLPLVVGLVCASRLFTGVAGAEAFFAVDADPFLGCVVASRSSIHASIEAALRNTSKAAEVEGRLVTVQEQLRASFESLPRNQHGRLGSAGARYLLHRHFLHQRAWLVRGLAPDGQAWGASFPVEILQDGAPQEVRVIVADHLKGRGLSLREVAVLAIMLENQVLADGVEKLRGVWQAEGLRPQETVNASTLQRVVSAHALTYLLPELFESRSISAASLEEARGQALGVYPTWPQTQEFLSQTVQGVAKGQQVLNFGVAERTVTQVIEEFGQWQGKECQELKGKLLALESSRPGRVDLASFYGAALTAHESLPYLKELGILDESEPGFPSVIIPNYLSSPSNYIMSSRHFAVACADECDGLLRHVERRIGTPTSSTGRLAAVVQDLPSSSQPARSALPAPLLQKLQDIAAVHGGSVPLHGRLFAMWMHHAFPRECPYPHVARTTQPLLPEEYEARMHGTAWESEEKTKAMARLLKELKVAGAAGNSSIQTPMPLPWDTQEELLEAGAVRPSHKAPDKRLILTISASAVALVSAAVTAVRIVARVSAARRQQPEAKTTS